jgi:hypothetical protein
VADTIGRHQHHPDVQRSWTQWSEDQLLHVAVPYSNPFRYRTRRELLNNFRRQMAAFPNVRLYIGELAYGDRPFEVTGIDPEAPLEMQERFHNQFDIQFRTDCEMFHKENILNAIISRFPADWKYGAYIDGDMIFTRHDWALEAIHLLQHYDVIQLFSSYTDLDAQHQPYGMARSFGWNFHHQEEFLAERRRFHGKPELASSGSGVFKRSDIRADVFPFGYDPGAPGGAWAWRRSAYDTLGGLLDVNILGGGDSEMAHGLIGVVLDLTKRTASPQPRAENAGTRSHAHAVLEWQKRAAKLHSNIGYLEQHILHPFHGSKRQRRYYERWKILRDHDFNPYTDLVPDWQRIYRWSGDKPRLRDAVRKYLIERREDDPNLYGGEKPLL